MSGEPIPEDVRRFILTSIPSVPHLEAMLLLREKHEEVWDSQRLGQRLYMSDSAASQLLDDLRSAGVLAIVPGNPPHYRYQPISDELHQAIGNVAAVYAKKIVEVANLIHSSTSKKAQHFADAFKLRKD